MRLVLLCLLAGCATETLDVRVDVPYWELTTDDTPVGERWSLRVTYGETPGHGDTIRHIYADPLAQTFGGDRAYPQGSMLVKEIYENVGGREGALQVIETMHRTESVVEDSTFILYEKRMGWVFGAASTRNGPESDKSDFCWRRCHVNAPISGAWFDYSVPVP